MIERERFIREKKEREREIEINEHISQVIIIKALRKGSV